jgi:hypothetical protein
VPGTKNPTDSLDEVGLFDFETKIRKMMFDMIDPWMKRQVAD